LKQQRADFISRLESLSDAERSLLRRNAGLSLAESRNALGLFYRLLPRGANARRLEEQYFLVATLYCVHRPEKLPQGTVATGSFGATLYRMNSEYRMRTGADNAGLERRFTALLDADDEQLRFRMRQMVRLANSSRAGIDWETMLADILNWHQPDRRVQKKWARDFFAPRQEQVSSEEPGAAEPTELIEDEQSDES
jgi:CRISPR system Cascade subunit CasB